MKPIQRKARPYAFAIVLALPVAFAATRTAVPRTLVVPRSLPSTLAVMNLKHEPRLESRMPVVLPDATFRDPMPVFVPDSSIDFTLRIVRPPLQSAPTPTPP